MSTLNNCIGMWQTALITVTLHYILFIHSTLNRADLLLSTQNATGL